MPIFMDLHIVPGVNAKDVADAHSMDVLMEKEHSCKCLTYWIDELRGHVFCLIDAPNQESVIELHNRAHGLVPHKIVEVEPNLVYSFLGRITDPDNAQVSDKGLIILDDTSYRILLCAQICDTVLLQQAVGADTAATLSAGFYKTIRQLTLQHHGREVIREGQEYLASFVAATDAFAAACAIQQALGSDSPLKWKLSIHAGEPIMQTDALFGDTVTMLRRMNLMAQPGFVQLTNTVKVLLSSDQLASMQSHLQLFAPQDEPFITQLFDVLQEHYAEEHFDIEQFAQAMAMSSTQLYRKTQALWQVSPNALLKEFRLQQALAMLRTKDASIAQISYATGFSSPSYFTKCFKNRFHMLPLQYTDMANQ